jgi:PAS domain S-box-containing protein
MNINDEIEKGKYDKDLRKQLEKYRLITENINDLIALTNDNFEHEYINEHVTSKLMGYNSNDLIGKSIFKLIHPSDLNYARKEIDRISEKGEGSGLVRYHHKNGHWEWLEVRAKRFKDVNNNFKVLFISRIVTDRVEYRNRLEKSEKKYRLITENANDLISMFDEQLNITYINEKPHKKTLGYVREDLIGKPMWKFIHPNDLGNTYKKFENQWKMGKSRAKLRFKKKDGSYIWLEVVSVKCLTDDNQIYGINIARDISKRKRFEDLIKKENKKLKKLNKVRKNLINRVSHELRTPMSCITGSIELMEEFFQDKLDKKDMEIISIAKRGSRRLKSLINNILQVSKIDASKLNLKKERVRFKNMVDNCLAELTYLIEKKKLDVNTEIKDDLELIADQLRIEEVIINILSNAIKNTPDLGTLTISLQKRGDHAIFSVKDSGIGITKEQMEFLFKKFGKIEREEFREDINTKGSGLGLYISKEIIKKHNGDIWAESEGKNKGTTFYFTLPLP